MMYVKINIKDIAYLYMLCICYCFVLLLCYSSVLWMYVVWYCY